MRQDITAVNMVDDHGTPTGGGAIARGIMITWQNGPLREGERHLEPNGAFVEGVIEIARQRLEYFQTASGGRFACSENMAAIKALEIALAVLDFRYHHRQARHVEGTHTP